AQSVIPTLTWDKLNAELGAEKKINLIIVGFNSSDAMLGQYQQAKWFGGKKNDFVITYGGNANKPDWCYVFGWTESELAKQDVTSFIVQNGIATTNFIPFLRNEIVQNYQIKQWK